MPINSGKDKSLILIVPSFKRMKEKVDEFAFIAHDRVLG